MTNELKANSESYESAAAEARDRGMAFIVDGRHVNADRVLILSVPDTIGPISNMRREKQEGQRLLQEMEAFSANVSKPMNKAHVELTGQHMRQLLDACGLEKKPHWDDTYLGMHSYITMVDIEAKIREMAQELHDVKRTYTAWKDEHKGQPISTYSSVAGALDDAFNRMDLQFYNAINLMSKRDKSMLRINHMLGGGNGPETSVDESCEFTEAGVKTMLENFAKYRGHSVLLNSVLVRMAERMGLEFKDDSLYVDIEALIERYFSALPGVVITTMRDGSEHVDNSQCKFAAGGAACTLWCGDSHCRPTVINGILVTDPDLAAPITDAATGTSCACGICGKLFDGPGLFCGEHTAGQ